MAAVSSYTGRFAPSPTGELHFGSLVAALASYLDARAAEGRWLVRMEDIDPPREQRGAASAILKALECYGLHWDGPVLHQSSRLHAYRAVLEELCRRSCAYRCDCTRKKLASTHPLYPGFCRQRTVPADTPAAVRLKCTQSNVTWVDRIQGHQSWKLGSTGDFIILRKDGLFAYQLAVVVDDAWQGVTHVVRGRDLLDSTARQVTLQRTLGYHTPTYAHIPLVVGDTGQKLSKQYGAAPIPLKKPEPILLKALAALGLPLCSSLHGCRIDALLDWAVHNWRINRVPTGSTMPH